MALKSLTPTEILQSASFGLLGPSNNIAPPPGMEPLDVSGQRTYNALQAETQLSPQDLIAKATQGTDRQSIGVDGGINNLSKQVSSLGGGQALNSALLNRFNDLYSQADYQRNKAVELNAPVESLKNKSSFTKVLTKQAMANAEASRQQLNFIQQQANQKAQMYQQLFSTAGTIGGAIIGGPMGAAAGGAIGKNMAPQSQAFSSGTSQQAPMSSNNALNNYNTQSGWGQSFSQNNKFY